MSESARTSPCKPRKLKDVPGWDYETDVAVVGFGGAGGCAAIAAADGGADTIILELASDAGGSTALSSAEIYMGGSGGTRVQKACGFEDSTEDMFNYMMECAGPQADAAKIRAYCEGSAAHFDWLTELGVPFKDSFHAERAIMCLTDDCLLYTGSEKAWPFADKAKPCPRGHNLQVEGDNGGPLFMKIIGENVARRDNISVHYETRVLSLISDDDGRICGVVIRQNQQEKHVLARRGVILCAGGFVMNEDMVARYAPMLTRGTQPIGNPGDTGTGILMGMGAGGAAVNMHEGFISLPFYPPASITYGIMVNDKGQRFINEDVYHGRLGAFALRQPSDRLYFVLNVEDYGNYETESWLGAGVAGTGETIAELEEELGLRSGSLANTIEMYNEDVANGSDTQYHKSPEWLKPLQGPMVALDMTPGRGAFVPFFTLGGLDTKPSGEVLNPEQDTVAGLYAAGRTACGVVRRAEGYSSGMSVGDASWSGRMAGISAAAAPIIDTADLPQQSAVPTMA